MSKYTSKQIAESDDLFEKQIRKVRKFYLSRNPDKMMMLEERKAVIKERNKGLSPEYDKEYYCGTCGAKDGAEHPKTGYCFHCDTDNWMYPLHRRAYINTIEKLRTLYGKYLEFDSAEDAFNWWCSGVSKAIYLANKKQLEIQF